MTIPYDDIRRAELGVAEMMFRLRGVSLTSTGEPVVATSDEHYMEAPRYVTDPIQRDALLAWLDLNDYDTLLEVRDGQGGWSRICAATVIDRRTAIQYHRRYESSDFTSVCYGVGYALANAALAAETGRTAEQSMTDYSPWEKTKPGDELHTCHDACSYHDGEEPPRDFEPIPPRRVYRLQAWLSRRGGMW